MLNKPTAMTGMMVRSLVIERLMKEPFPLNDRLIFRGVSPSRDFVFRELIDGYGNPQVLKNNTKNISVAHPAT